MNSMERMRRPGGTEGGLGSFLLGGVLAVAGGYLLLSQVDVRTNWYRGWFGDHTFGITLIPFILGVGLLFFNGKSLPGWILAIGGTVAIFAGVIASMDIYFLQTSLFIVLVILVMLVAGLGLMARALLR
jgi:uncharacterized protein